MANKFRFFEGGVHNKMKYLVVSSLLDRDETEKALSQYYDDKRISLRETSPHDDSITFFVEGEKKGCKIFVNEANKDIFWLR